MAPNRWWTPEYSIGNGKMPLNVYDRRLPQCPTGFVTAESIGWVDEYYRIRSASKASNSPYFASLEKVDPRTVTALELIGRENQRIDADIREESMRQS